MRGFDRAQREYEGREPEEGTLCGYCWSRGEDVELVEDECPRCSEEPAVFLGLVGSVGTLLLWLFLAAPGVA